jgi:hypothetical protein
LSIGPDTYKVEDLDIKTIARGREGGKIHKIYAAKLMGEICHTAIHSIIILRGGERSWMSGKHKPKGSWRRLAEEDEEASTCREPTR